MDSLDDSVRIFYAPIFNDRSITHTYNCEPMGKVLVIFGSAANGASNPRDVDVLSYKASESDIRSLIDNNPMLQSVKNLPLDMHQINYIEKNEIDPGSVGFSENKLLGYRK